MKRLFYIAVIVMFLSACTNSSAEEEVNQDSENDDETTELKNEDNNGTDEDAPRLWDQADAQLWEYVHKSSTDNEYEGGNTEWGEWDADIADLTLSNEVWDTPGALMLAFMTDIEIGSLLGNDVWEINNRINMISETEAEGYFMIYGMKDDSVAGRDIKLTMKVKGGAWFIESVEERQRCSRGVDSSGDLCI